MWEVFFLGTARRTESQRSDSRDGILREIETGCKNLVAMGVIGRNRASRGNWSDSERRERDMVAGAKGRRRNAIVEIVSSRKRKGVVKTSRAINNLGKVWKQKREDWWFSRGETLVRIRHSPPLSSERGR